MAEKLHPDYEVVIGIEVHVQLTTKSKIFCSCPNKVSNEPNINICPVCAGHPGTLPLFNEEVLNYAVKAGLATHCTINIISEFARKHYFYPDLPKGYQITQNDKPICSRGYVTIRLDDDTKKNIRLMRIHMEEDAGKNVHVQGSNESFVDLNRAGTPLLEIVTEPDISSAEEARKYLKTLRSIVMYLDICTGNMEEGAFRADTNISVRRKGEKELGTKVELKNINSFKFIGDAIEYEITRQVSALEEGKKIIQETRLWDTTKHVTLPMRAKEQAADYRYFPDPDLPLLELDNTLIEEIKKTMPELPEEKFEKFLSQYGLSTYEAEILISDLALAHYYEETHKLIKSKLVANWILRDVMGYIKDKKITLAEFSLTPTHLAELIELLENDTINARAAQQVFLICAETGKSPRIIVKEKGLEQMSNVAELESIIKEIIKFNPQQVEGYKAGNERLFSFFVGQAMKKTEGKANPKTLNELLKKYLG